MIIFVVRCRSTNVGLNWTHCHTKAGNEKFKKARKLRGTERPLQAEIASITCNFYKVKIDCILCALPLCAHSCHSSSSWRRAWGLHDSEKEEQIPSTLILDSASSVLAVSVISTVVLWASSSGIVEQTGRAAKWRVTVSFAAAAFTRDLRSSTQRQRRKTPFGLISVGL